jgi:membrane protein DedA with SNARE-associated domain
MGLRKYPYPRFLGLSAIGGVLWAVFTCTLSYSLGEWLSGRPVLSILLSVVVSGAIVFGMVLVLRRRYLRRRGPRAGTTPAEASTTG